MLLILMNMLTAQPPPATGWPSPKTSISVSLRNNEGGNISFLNTSKLNFSPILKPEFEPEIEEVPEVVVVDEAVEEVDDLGVEVWRCRMDLRSVRARWRRWLWTWEWMCVWV
jgi:hypothetical protein